MTFTSLENIYFTVNFYYLNKNILGFEKFFLMRRFKKNLEIFIDVADELLEIKIKYNICNSF